MVKNHAYVVILAHICQKLRQVAVSTPLLWTTLSLSNERHPQAKVELWLARSRGFLRGLYIRDTSDAVQDALESLSRISLDNLRALAVGACRFFEGDPPIDLSFLTPAIVSNLQSLTLTAVDFPWLDGTSKLQIRHLDTRTSIHDWGLLADRTGQLRVLHHEDSWDHPCGIADILCLLRNNPNLESITLKFYSWLGALWLDEVHQSPPRLHGPIELPHLTHFSLYGDSLPARLWLPSLSFRNLRHLELEGLCKEWDDFIQCLLSMDAVSHLISLAIVYRHFGVESEMVARPDTFIKLLRHTKQLRCLELFRVTYIGPVVRALADDPSTFCPNLRTLDVSRCPDVDDELLLAIVAARNGSHDKPSGDSPVSASTGTVTTLTLHKLVFNSCEKVNASAVSWIRARVPHVTCHYNRKRRERNHRKPKRGEPYVWGHLL